MQLETFTEVKKTAHAKWREYREAEKATKGKEPLYTDLKKFYWQIKHGKVLIDISQVIKAGGVHNNHHPKLAVALASSKRVQCLYKQDGTVFYRNPNLSARVDVELPACLPTYQFQDKNGWRFLELSAPVPMIPPKHRPKQLDENHYILWEVDKWEMVPPTDPYLLRRITKNIFAVEAQWDLTELEKAAMAGRMH